MYIIACTFTYELHCHTVKLPKFVRHVLNTNFPLSIRLRVSIVGSIQFLYWSISRIRLSDYAYEPWYTLDLMHSISQYNVVQLHSSFIMSYKNHVNTVIRKYFSTICAYYKRMPCVHFLIIAWITSDIENASFLSDSHEHSSVIN